MQFRYSLIPCIVYEQNFASTYCTNIILLLKNRLYFKKEKNSTYLLKVLNISERIRNSSYSLKEQLYARGFYEITFRSLIQALRQFSGLLTKVAFNHLEDEPRVTDWNIKRKISSAIFYLLAFFFFH